MDGVVCDAAPSKGFGARSLREISNNTTWLVLQGLPATGKTLHCELLVSYNCCLEHFPNPDDGITGNHRKLLHTTLVRLLQVCSPKQVVDIEDTTISNKQLCFLFHLCIECCSEALLEPFGLQPTTSGNIHGYFTHTSYDISGISNGFNQQVQQPSDDVRLLDLLHLHLGLHHLDSGNLLVSQNHFEKASTSVIREQSPSLLYAAAYTYYQCGMYTEARSLLDQWRSQPVLAAESAADLWNLYGCILSSQNQHKEALRMFDLSSQVDPELAVPLYNKSIQQRAMSQTALEIQALDQVFNLMSKLETAQLSQNALDSTCALESTMSSSNIMNEMLVVLAKRYMELGRFKEATAIFRKLLSQGGEMKPDGVYSQPDENTTDIFSSYVFCLQQDGRWTDALLACDEVLKLNDRDSSIFAMDTNPDTDTVTSTINSSKPSNRGSDAEELSGSQTVVRNKRLRSESVEVNSNLGTWQDPTDKEVLALMYKADSHFMLGQHDNALMCLDCVIKHLSGIFEDPAFNCPSVSKKRRIETGDQSSDLEKHPSVLTPGMLSDVLGKKAIILMKKDKIQEALECSKAVMGLMPDAVSVVYNYCLMLWKVKDWTESARIWLHHRGITVPPNPILLRRQIEKKESRLLNQKETGESRHLDQEDETESSVMTEPDGRSLLLMDLKSLKQQLQESQCITR